MSINETILERLKCGCLVNYNKVIWIEHPTCLNSPEKCDIQRYIKQQRNKNKNKNNIIYNIYSNIIIKIIYIYNKFKYRNIQD